MRYNVHVRARNVVENSLNVVLCTFPHFFLKSILTPMVMIHNLVVETHFMTQFEHSSSYVFLCAGTVLLPAISTARLHGACSFDDLKPLTVGRVSRVVCWKTIDTTTRLGLRPTLRVHHRHCGASSRSSSPCTSRATHSNCGLLTRRTSVNH